jgi:hypothetical protein
MQSEGKGIGQEISWTIARTIQQDWQNSENRLSENLWPAVRQGILVSTVSGVGKMLTSQRCQP